MFDDGGDDNLGVATAFVARRSRRPALQEAKAGVPPIRTRKQPPNKAGLSLLLTHPIILRDLPPHADARPSQSELTRLHRTLTQRDLVILQSLYDYRYLNTLQVKELFFPSLRSCQMRLQYLKELGLIYSWKVIETPGVKRRHSLLLISARGARVLADWHGDDQRAYVERSHAVRDHCWHATHDLEANQLFVALVMQSRQRRARAGRARRNGAGVQVAPSDARRERRLPQTGGSNPVRPRVGPRHRVIGSPSPEAQRLRRLLQAFQQREATSRPLCRSLRRSRRQRPLHNLAASAPLHERQLLQLLDHDRLSAALVGSIGSDLGSGRRPGRKGPALRDNECPGATPSQPDGADEYERGSHLDRK